MSCDLKNAFTFVYRKELDNDLIEHELDHVLMGRCDVKPQINPSEVQNWEYRSIEEIRDSMSSSPDEYTVWFRICFEEVCSFLK